MKSKSISIIIPCYNEEDYIEKSLEKLYKFLKEHNIIYEIIIVDDGSNDKTVDKVKNTLAKLSDLILKIYKLNSNIGKGAALRYGMKNAENEIIIFIDADLTYDLDIINKMITIHNESDVAMVCGSRHIKGEKTYTYFPLKRRIVGGVFSLIIKLFLFDDIIDTQCGIKSIKSHVANKIIDKLKVDDFGFDIELLYIVKKQICKKVVFIPAYPVYLRKESKVSIIKDSVLMLFDLIKIKFLNKY